MGDPRKQRRKYEKPQHPWKAERITQEGELCKKYGLKNKREIWKAKSIIGRFRQQARKLLGSSGEEAEKGKKKLLDKLNRLGIMETRSIEDVLGLSVEDLLERRMQTMVYRKGFANTIKQARQIIAHGHILIGDNVVNVPGYIVSRDEEDKLRIDDKMKVVDVEERK
ncbi:MAG: 30S ribosomal protein S4 [Candidatus Altiarchaeales archaeon ex4484_43]|nr:MAG: 30S ribosomal protein S4 [Candidatus Altiarchaeales archaeon ex4484_43]RLI88726.1 MAG: 30S ribosomal protein S4 [Candidatus Altiarchaeales archaeon]